MDRRLRRLLVSAVGVGGLLLATAPASAAAVHVMDSNVPLDCPTVLPTPSTGNLVKTQRSSVDHGDGFTTYIFGVHTTRTGASFSGIEDCAYANGDPTNIKYGTSGNQPPFNSSGNATTTLTIDTRDTICDRVRVTGTDANNVAFTDYSNLVGNCGPKPNVPEAPLGGLLLVSGVGVAGAVWLTRRRTSSIEV